MRVRCALAVKRSCLHRKAVSIQVVWTLAKPYQDAGKVDEAGKTRGKVVEARKHTTKVLEFVEKAFDEMAFAVELRGIVTLDFWHVGEAG